MNRTRWIALGAGMLSLLVVIAVVRQGRQSTAPESKGEKSRTARKGYYVPPKKPAPAATPDVMARAIDEARVRSTYQNYRKAVALGHRRLQESFRRSLMRDPAAAVRIAEEGVASAQNEVNREIARKALEGLRP